MKITKPYYIIFLLFIVFFVLFSQLFMVKQEGFSLETPTSNTSTTTTDT